MEKKIQIRLVEHRGQRWIAVSNYTNSIAAHLRARKGTRYSTILKAWLLPDTEENRSWCRQVFPDRRSIMPTSTAPVQVSPKPVLLRLSETNQLYLNRCKQELVLRAYSISTQKTYLQQAQVFLQWCGDKDAALFSIAQLRDYFERLLTEGYSVNLVHSRLNAVKFLYERVLKGPQFWVDLPRPQKGFQLPNFFSAEEVASILNHTDNLKHKSMLAVCYSAGLRVSEVVKLKITDILGDRHCILVREGKGRKDRILPLSPVVLVLLREYYRQYRLQPRGYLFPGQLPDEPYSARSLQLVLQAAKKRAGILKPGAVHALRHSFATHLLDKGTDVTMIQKLLGHNDIQTTLRYLHTSHKDLLQIISPIDHLGLNIPKSLPDK